MPATVYSLYEFDSKSDSLISGHVIGDSNRLIVGLTIPLGQRVTGWAGANRRTAMNSDASLDLAQIARGFQPHLVSAISTPLTAQDRLIGVLTAYSLQPEAFDEGHRYTFEHVCATLTARICTLQLSTITEPTFFPKAEDLRISAQSGGVSVAFSYEAASKLFGDGEFLALVQASGRSHDERRAYEPRQRVIVANALAVVGQLEAAQRLAELDRDTPTPPAIRSQSESTFCVIQRRLGNHIAALHHAQAAVFLAQESGEAQRIAWAQLHLFRVLIEIGPFDKAVASLADTRRLVAKAGNNDAIAYLHICVSILEGQVGRLDEARRHCDIAEGLLQRSTNVWLSASCLINRGCIAWLTCHLDEASDLFRVAREKASRSGHGYLIQATDTCIGYTHMLMGEFAKAEQTYLAASRDATADIGSRLSSLGGLARYTSHPVESMKPSR